MTPRTLAWLLRTLVVLTAILLGLGLLLPAFALRPGLGGWEDLARPLGFAFVQERGVALLAGIVRLLRAPGWGDRGIGAVLFLFTVAFPVWKLAVFAQVAFDPQPAAHRHGRALRLAAVLGKFSMVDVLVIALLVLAVKALPGGSCVVLRAGCAAFVASVLGSLLLGLGVCRLVGRPAEDPGPGG